MTRGEDKHPLLSRILTSIQNVLVLIGAVAAGLTTLLPLIFPDNFPENWAKLIVGVGTILFVAASGLALYYYRRRTAWLAIPEPAEPLATKAVLRGLLPFEEDDELPGRIQEVQDLYTLVASNQFRFGVLWGESGCGKTSLLRAALVPLLHKEGFLPVYVPRPAPDPRQAIHEALNAALNKPPDNADDLTACLRTLPAREKVVCVLDQFEELFTAKGGTRARSAFIKWLGQTIADPEVRVAFLVSIRADFFAQLHLFHPAIAEPTSPRTTYQLPNFDRDKAKQILKAAAEADAAPFEPELINAVVNDLESEEIVRPAELQIVGTWLKRRHLLTRNKYEIVGRARGILGSHIGDEVRRSANEQTARLVLRLMCTEDGLAKSPENLSLKEIMLGISAARTNGGSDVDPHLRDEVLRILGQLVTARILIRMDDKYNLVHDYLAPYVYAATEGSETNVGRANRLLRRYLAEYREDPRTRIPYRHLREIRRYASVDVKYEKRVRELLTKSLWSALYDVSTALLVIPLTFLVVIYLYLASSYYLSIEPAMYEGGPRPLVVRAGHPKWKFLPGFGMNQVVVQTDFTEDDLDPDLIFRYEVVSEQLTNFWFVRSNGYDGWGEQLSKRLEPLSKAQSQRWLGQPERSAETLASLAHPQTDARFTAGFYEASSLLVWLAEGNPTLVTPEVVQPLIAAIIDLRTDYMFGSILGADEYAGFINQQNDYERALDTLVRLAEMNRAVVASQITPEVVAPLVAAVLSNWSRYAMNTLVRLAEVNPAVVASQITPEVVAPLVAIITDPQADPERLATAMHALGQLAEVNSAVISEIAPEMVAPLVGIVTETLARDALDALVRLAEGDPTLVTPEVVQPLMATIVDPSQADLYSCYYVIEALVRLAEVNPAIVTPEVVAPLVAIITYPQADQEQMHNVNHVTFALTVLTLTRLAEVNRKVISEIAPEAVASLVVIVALSTDYSVSEDALEALVRLAEMNPAVVASQITPEVIAPLVATISPSRSISTIDFFENEHIVAALVRLAEMNPAVVASQITPEVIAPLVAVITDLQEGYYTRTAVAVALRRLVEVNPAILTPKVAQSLVALVTGVVDLEPDPETYEELDMNVEILKRLAEVNWVVFTSQITPEVVQPLVAIITDPQTDPYTSNDALDALVGLAEVNPAILTPEVVQPLVAPIADPRADDRLRADAVHTLERLAEVNRVVVISQVTPEVVQYLMYILTQPQYTNSETIRTVSRIFEYVSLAAPDVLAAQREYLNQANLNRVSPDIINAVAWMHVSAPLSDLFILLQSQRDSMKRSIGAYALFLTALYDPSQEQLIRDGLENLRNHPQPHVRIAASRTLEMMKIGQWVQVAQTQPGQVAAIKSRLDELRLEFDLGLSSEEHLIFAATVASEKMEE